MYLKQFCGNTLIHEDLPGALPILNDFRQENETSTIILTSSLEQAFMKVQETIRDWN
jgi:hypothetical protein